jgi:hypothetical protein
VIANAATQKSIQARENVVKDILKFLYKFLLHINKIIRTQITFISNETNLACYRDASKPGAAPYENFVPALLAQFRMDIAVIAIRR